MARHWTQLLAALLVGIGVGYLVRPGQRPMATSDESQDAGRLTRDGDLRVGAMATGLTDGEWWANEKGVQMLLQLESGRGHGVVAKGKEAVRFTIRLASFDLVGAKAEFTVERDGQPSTWAATLDMGDPEAPAPTDQQLEAERYEVIPMTVWNVYGSFCSDMAPFKLWRKYPGDEVHAVARLRMLLADDKKDPGTARDER